MTISQFDVFIHNTATDKVIGLKVGENMDGILGIGRCGYGVENGRSDGAACGLILWARAWEDGVDWVDEEVVMNEFCIAVG